MYNSVNIFLPYDCSLIFEATITDDRILEVQNFDNDVEFKAFYNAWETTWQIYYLDPVTHKQQYYRYRAVDLHPIGGDKFVLNFNFSYPRYIPFKHSSFVNHLKKEIFAGVDHTLF